MKVVFASHNAGKIKELTHLLQDFQIELIPQAKLQVTEIEETGLTFVENALLKARHASAVTGMPAISDDSGLIVDALSGRPGIYSARYAGENATAKANIEKLLIELKNIPADKRTAAFYCALVFVKDAHDPTPLICEGIWRGTILEKVTGEQGFGYDPVFFDPTHQCSAAELALDIKNRISHRGLALQSLMTRIKREITC
jgi:XTP/dITP diphosphohydrolase